jgi:hypothetical protein
VETGSLATDRHVGGGILQLTRLGVARVETDEPADKINLGCAAALGHRRLPGVDALARFRALTPEILSL